MYVEETGLEGFSVSRGLLASASASSSATATATGVGGDSEAVASAVSSAVATGDSEAISEAIANAQSQQGLCHEHTLSDCVSCRLCCCECDF